MARPTMYAVALALIALAAAQDCANDACAASSEEEAAAMLQLRSGGETSPPVHPAPAPCSFGDHVACPGSGNMCAGDQCCPGFAGSGGKTFPCPSSNKTSFSGCQNDVQTFNCVAAPTPAPTSSGGQQLGQNCGSCGGTGFTYPDCAPGLVCKPLSGNRVGGCPTCQRPPPSPTPAPGAKEGQRCGFNSDGFTYPGCESGLYCMEPPQSAGVGAYSKCVRKCGVVPNQVTGGCSAGTKCSCNTMPCRSWEENCFLYCC